MVRITTSLAAAFLLAAPAVLAIPVPVTNQLDLPELVTRQLPEPIDFLEREFDEVYDLDAREPFSGRKSVGTAPHPHGFGLQRAKSLTARDDELEAREPVFGFGGPKTSGTAPHPKGHGLQRAKSLTAREEELDAREPFSGRKSVGTAPHPQGFGLHRAKSLTGREEEDVEFIAARDYVLEKLNEYAAREEVEEIAAREPGFKEWIQNLGQKIKGAAQSVASKIKGAFTPKKKVDTKDAAEVPDAREVDEFEEVAAREFDDDLEEFAFRDFEDSDELTAREPGVKEWFQNLGQKIKGAAQSVASKIKGAFTRKKTTTTTTTTSDEPEVREIDEELMDLLERELDLE
jgi:DnaJ-domain-containing protein 1